MVVHPCKEWIAILKNGFIWGLCCNFVECESFFESNSPDILALCKTNIDDSICFGNISVMGYLPLIQNNSITHMYGLAVSMKKGLSFAEDLSLENLEILATVFDWLYFTECLTSLYINHLLHLYALFLFHITYFSSSNI